MKTTTLSPEDQAAYDSLVDPDADANLSTPTFDWGVDFQRSVLGALLVDRPFMAEHADLIKYSNFTNNAHKSIAKILLGHWAKYKSLPSKLIIQEELKKEAKAEDRLFVLAELNMTYDTYEPGLDSRDYRRDKILSFARRCRICSAMLDAGKEMQSPKGGEVDWDKIHDIIKQAILMPQGYDLGLDYFGTLEERYARMGDELAGLEVFTTAIPSLDGALTNGGMRRGEIYGVMSPPGVGKSLYLTRVGVMNLIRQKKVLYITLEMSPDDIALRFDAQLADSDIRRLLADKDEVIPKVASVVGESDDKQRLVVKQFPSGSASVDTIRAFFDQTQMFGFRADVVIVDYVGEMKDVKGLPTYESRERLVKELRGFAVEQDVLVVTAFQPNRDGKEAMEVGVIDDSMLADAYGQLRPLDGLWTLNQSQADKDQNIGRLYIAKLRNGESRRTYHIQYNPRTLAITEIAKEKYYARLGDYRKPTKTDEDVKTFFGNRKKSAA